MPVKLVVSDTIMFRVDLMVPDSGGLQAFAFNARAQRVSPIKGEEIIVDYLKSRAKVTISDWIGPPLLVDDTGQPVVGDEALAFLLDEIGGAHLVLLSEYGKATNAQAKQGNSSS